jgi:hypothetical protein
MKSDNENRSSVFNFPILLTLTVILCLVSYQVFGLNTAIGVATGSAVLALFAVKRKTKNPAGEWN